VSKIQYIDKNFRKDSLTLIDIANGIIEDFEGQGFDLTLRQLYYQFVINNLFPESWVDVKTGSTNNMKSYKKLVDLVSNGRLAGKIDWNSITDRTRSVNEFSFWDDIPEIIRSAQYAYTLDKWADQLMMFEVWVEKDALINIVGKACDPFEVPSFSCRGYVSQSAMWRAAQRIIDYEKPTTILHLGDHDPSGIDMTRDIEDRLQIFGADNVNVKRIALSQKQVKKYKLPPNPAKITDSRADRYIEEYGRECWELDALSPKVLIDLIVENIDDEINHDILYSTKQMQDAGRLKIKKISDNIDLSDMEE